MSDDSEPTARVNLSAVYQVVLATQVAVAEVKGSLALVAVERRRDAKGIEDHEDRLRALETTTVSRGTARWLVTVGITLAIGLSSVIAALVAAH